MSALRDTTIDIARSIPIEDELARRGIRLRRQGRELTGPCPLCGGTDRFSANTRKQTWNCRQCKPATITGDVIGLVRHLDGCDFRQAIRTLTGDRPPPPSPKPAPAKPKTDDEYDREQHRKAAWLWSQRRPITGTIAERYLRARGITCALPQTLGFLPANGKYPPAMIAAYAIPSEPGPGVLGAPRDVKSVHITRLLPDGSDREGGDDAKITLGTRLGRPIVLAPPNDLLALAISEGIEDALSIHQALGIGAWAAGSAPYMPKLAARVPRYIEAVHVELHPD
jgi:hypothetical protein